MRKALTYALLLLLGAAAASAQSVERQVVGVAGFDGSAGGVQLSATVGEAVTFSAQTGSFLLSQGFQQPENQRVSIEPAWAAEVSYRLYPNPTYGKASLQLDAPRPVELLLALSDAAGRQVMPEIRLSFSGSILQPLDLSALSAGVYMLSLRDEQGQEALTLRIEKRG
jgi:uncharacterized protein (DUF58 family)